jgi:hypothetical protein
MDTVLAGLGVLVFSPLLLVLALLVKLTSRGPVLFGHRRLGEGGTPIRVYKFRSMVVDAEVRLQEVLAVDPSLRTEYEATYKLRDDPRVTRLGRWLRRTSLDELPQLFNVLRGEPAGGVQHHVPIARPQREADHTQQSGQHEQSFSHPVHCMRCRCSCNAPCEDRGLRWCCRCSSTTSPSHQADSAVSLGASRLRQHLNAISGHPSETLDITAMGVRLARKDCRSASKRYFIARFLKGAMHER